MRARQVVSYKIPGISKDNIIVGRTGGSTTTQRTGVRDRPGVHDRPCVRDRPDASWIIQAVAPTLASSWSKTSSVRCDKDSHSRAASTTTYLVLYARRRGRDGWQ